MAVGLPQGGLVSAPPGARFEGLEAEDERRPGRGCFNYACGGFNGSNQGDLDFAGKMIPDRPG